MQAMKISMSHLVPLWNLQSDFGQLRRSVRVGPTWWEHAGADEAGQYSLYLIQTQRWNGL